MVGAETGCDHALIVALIWAPVLCLLNAGRALFPLCCSHQPARSSSITCSPPPAPHQGNYEFGTPSGRIGGGVGSNLLFQLQKSLGGGDVVWAGCQGLCDELCNPLPSPPARCRGEKWDGGGVLARSLQGEEGREILITGILVKRTEGRIWEGWRRGGCSERQPFPLSFPTRQRGGPRASLGLRPVLQAGARLLKSNSGCFAGVRDGRAELWGWRGGHRVRV